MNKIRSLLLGMTFFSLSAPTTAGQQLAALLKAGDELAGKFQETGQDISQYRQQIKDLEAELPARHRSDLHKLVVNVTIGEILKSPEANDFKKSIESEKDDFFTKETLMKLNWWTRGIFYPLILLCNKEVSELHLVVLQKTAYLEEELRQIEKAAGTTPVKYQRLSNAGIIKEKRVLITLTLCSVVLCALSFPGRDQKVRKHKGKRQKVKKQGTKQVRTSKK